MTPQGLGPYRIVGELGQGGMGTVYRALDPRLGREVALKVLPPECVDADSLTRFQAEGQAAARLQHPNVVGLLDAGQDRGRAYLVMELIPGESLQQRLEREGPLPRGEVIRLGRRLAEALTAAHAVGVLHRDVTPGNVLLDVHGEPRLTDFGLSRLVDREDRLTRTGELVGTPAFMAPEQALGEELTPATDVHGLGAVLYAMLCARPPFDHVSVIAALEAVATKAPVPPRRLASGVDPGLEAICLRCLAKDPAQRYASPAEVGEALASLELAPPAPRRGRGFLTGAVCGAGLTALGAAALWAGAEPAPEPTPASVTPSVSPSAPASPASTPASTPAPPAAEDPRLAAATETLRELADALATRAPRQALTASERLVALRPDDPQAWLQKGRALRRLGRRADAEAAFARALAIDRRFVPALLARARLRFDQGEHDGAWADLDRAAAVGADEPRLPFLRARVLLARKQPAQALEQLDAALRREPTYVPALLLRGNLRYDANQLPGALADAQRLLKVQPRHVEGQLLAGSALANLGRFAEAERLLARSFQRRPSYLSGLRLGQVIQHQGGRLERSVAVFTRTLGLKLSQEQRSWLLLARAFSHALGNDVKRAARDLKQSGRAGHRQGQLIEAMLRFARGDHTGTLAVLEPLIAKHGKVPDYINYRAQARERLGQHRAAAEDYAWLAQRPSISAKKQKAYAQRAAELRAKAGTR